MKFIALLKYGRNDAESALRFSNAHERWMLVLDEFDQDSARRVRM